MVIKLNYYLPDSAPSMAKMEAVLAIHEKKMMQRFWHLLITRPKIADAHITFYIFSHGCARKFYSKATRKHRENRTLYLFGERKYFSEINAEKVEITN